MCDVHRQEKLHNPSLGDAYRFGKVMKVIKRIVKTTAD